MGLGIQPDDLLEAEKFIFEKGEEVKFICLDTYDNVTKESIMLKCKILSGEHEGKLYNLYLSKKRTFPHFIKKLRNFALAFYTREELKSGDQPLSRLYMRIFTAVAEEPREYKGSWFQDFGKWFDLGEQLEDGTIHKDQSIPKSTESNADIPF